jgi:endonuclease YncB( thermonuclease family)
MNRYHLSVRLLLCLLVVGVGSAWAGEVGVDSEIVLQGRTTQVQWNDGDTFTFRSGRFSGKTARLVGYNTLESYGPVHRWGEWSPAELYDLAIAARNSAAETRWACTKQPKKDTYGRLLVDCPGARKALIESGLAHVFAYSSAPEETDMKAQRAARSAQIGIWKKGRPEHIVTNVSADETGRVFLRVASARTGTTERRHQRHDYKACDEICEGPSVSGSCMIFIPYAARYSVPPICSP